MPWFGRKTLAKKKKLQFFFWQKTKKTTESSGCTLRRAKPLACVLLGHQLFEQVLSSWASMDRVLFAGLGPKDG